MKRNDKSGNSAPGVKKEKVVIGKLLIIGITYYKHDGTFIERKQLYGKVTNVYKDSIAVELEGTNAGTIFYIPRNLRALLKASPGIYELKSTGELVTNPDYTTMWNVTKPPPD